MSTRISTKWRTKPISKSCEVVGPGVRRCGRPTIYAYTAEEGWFSLCQHHGQKHVNDPGCEKAFVLVAKGERWADE